MASQNQSDRIENIEIVLIVVYECGALCEFIGYSINCSIS